MARTKQTARMSTSGGSPVKPRAHRLTGGTGAFSRAVLKPNLHRIAQSGRKPKPKPRNPKRKLVGGSGKFSKDAHQARAKPAIHRIAKSGRGHSLKRDVLIAKLRRMRLRRDVLKAKLARCKLRRHKCSTVSHDKKEKWHRQRERYWKMIARCKAKIAQLKAKCISAKRCKRQCVLGVQSQLARVVYPERVMAAWEGGDIRRAPKAVSAVSAPKVARAAAISEKKALEVLREIAKIRAPVEEVLEDDASDEKFHDYGKRQEKLVDKAQAERRKLLQSIDVPLPQVDDALFAETARRHAMNKAARLAGASAAMPSPLSVPAVPEPVMLNPLPMKKVPRRVAPTLLSVV